MLQILVPTDYSSAIFRLFIMSIAIKYAVFDTYRYNTSVEDVDHGCLESIPGICRCSHGSVCKPRIAISVDHIYHSVNFSV